MKTHLLFAIGYWLSPHPSAFSLQLLGLSDLGSSWSTAGWMVCLLSVLAGADRALKFFKDHIKEKPDPRETYATKGESLERLLELGRRNEDLNRRIEALRLEGDKRGRDLDLKIEELRKENKEDFNGVHERITSVFGEVMKLLGQMNARE